LVTGNGRCNLGNANQRLDTYRGSLVVLLPQVMKQTLNAQDFFAEMGVFCRQDQEGHQYPQSNQAASVLDALRFTVEQIGTETYCDCIVYNLSPRKDNILVQTNLDTFQAKAVIITTSGFAAPKTGSDGKMFSVLEKLGHSHSVVKPALVPFYTQPQQLRGLKGVRI